MMKYVFKLNLLLFIFVLILPLREAATTVRLKATHPDHKGKCYHSGPPPTILNVGETKRHPTICGKMYCTRNFTLRLATCGILGGPPDCWTIDGDPSKPHPYCCPEIIC